MEANIWQAIFLGIVQGLTEFIPVSSSAHVTLIPRLLGWESASTLFILFVHFGTLVALLTYFRAKIYNYIKVLFKRVTSRERLEDKQDRAEWRTIVFVVLAAIPAGLIGLLLSDAIENFYDSGEYPELVELSIVTAMAGVGLIFLFNDRLFTSKRRKIDRLTPLRAILVGISQAFAFVRGVSRSGITLLAGQAMGLSKVDAAEFSFLISIPILIGTSALSLIEVASTASEIGQDVLMYIIAGGVAAAVSGYFAISFMLNYLKNNNLSVFGWYRIIFAIVALILLTY